MKKIFSAIVLFASIHAGAAAFSWDNYSEQKLATHQRCAIKVCKAADSGGRFLGYCEFARKGIVPRDLPVMSVYEGGQAICYCPCTFDFESQIRASNLNGTN